MISVKFVNKIFT